jgi:hypothetical protein
VEQPPNDGGLIPRLVVCGERSLTRQSGVLLLKFNNGGLEFLNVRDLRWSITGFFDQGRFPPAA